jgi:hypothetical protein
MGRPKELRIIKEFKMLGLLAYGYGWVSESKIMCR